MKIEYHVIKKVEDFEEYKNSWEQIEHGKDMTVFQSFNWNKLLVEQWLSRSFNRLFSEIYIICLKNGPKVRIIAPLIIQKKSIGVKWLGRKKGIYFLGIESYSDYMNLIYDDDTKESEIETLLNDILKTFSEFTLRLSCVRDETLLSNWCLSQGFSDKLYTSVFVEIPDNQEIYTKSLSKSTRQNLRTAINRITRDNLTYEMLVYDCVQDEAFLNSLNQIHIDRVRNKNRKKAAGKLRYLSNFLRTRYQEFLDGKYNIIINSMSRLDNSVFVIVKLNDDIAGYLYGLRDGNTVRIMQNCYNEKYSFYSPLFRGAYDYILSVIAEDTDVKSVDFTRGDEEYKYKLGGKEHVLHSFLVSVKSLTLTKV